MAKKRRKKMKKAKLKRKTAPLCAPKTVETMRTPVHAGGSTFAPQMVLLIEASVQMDCTGMMKRSKSFAYHNHRVCASYISDKRIPGKSSLSKAPLFLCLLDLVMYVNNSHS